MPALSDEIREKIKAYIPRYPRKQAVTLPALHLVHDEYRTVLERGHRRDRRDCSTCTRPKFTTR